MAGVIAALLLFPETPAGAALRRLLVEAPARALNRLRRGHLALLLMISLMLAVGAALGREMMVVFAQGTPELIGWFAAFDIATYVDVIAAAVVVAAAVRLKTAFGLARAALRSLLAAKGARRPRRVRRRAQRRTPPAGPEEEPWPAALAAA